MTYADFSRLAAQNPNGVVLMEGRRAIPAAEARHAEKIAAQLANDFPALRFRSGNATGSDEAFSNGVNSVDARRLQIVAPYATHRKTARLAGAEFETPDALSPELETELDDVMAGGTGHTIRVCQMENIPVVFQNVWKTWLG